MMQLRVLALALMTFAFSPAFAQEEAGKKPSDSEIISEIHHKNKNEISVASLAEKRSANDSVLGLARRIVDDHKKADQKAIDLATRNKLEINDIAMTQPEQDNWTKLSSLMGAKFDEEFLKVMEKEHKAVISWLDGALKHAENSELKKYISDILPTLHQHHDLAAMVHKKNKATG